MELPPSGILGSKLAVRLGRGRFPTLFKEAIERPPRGLPKIMTLGLVELSSKRTRYTVGLTSYSTGGRGSRRGHQRITFYAGLLGALSDRAVTAVMAHELSHSWLNEHIGPEESRLREKEADELALAWGFARELEVLDAEAETVQR